MTTDRLKHRRTQLTDGPLAGLWARIYPEPGGTWKTTNSEPATITLCLGAQLPHWQPTGHTTYTRHPDGTYHWNGDTP